MRTYTDTTCGMDTYSWGLAENMVNIFLCFKTSSIRSESNGNWIYLYASYRIRAGGLWEEKLEMGDIMAVQPHPIIHDSQRVVMRLKFGSCI